MPLLKVSLSKGHTDAPNVSTTFYLNSSNSIQTFGNRITVKTMANNFLRLSHETQYI